MWRKLSSRTWWLSRCITVLVPHWTFDFASQPRVRMVRAQVPLRCRMWSCTASVPSTLIVRQSSCDRKSSLSSLMSVPFETICTLLPLAKACSSRRQMAGCTKGSPPEKLIVSIPSSAASVMAFLQSSSSMKSVSDGRRHIWQVRLQYSLSAMSMRS